MSPRVGDDVRRCAIERLTEGAQAGAPISALVATTAAALGISRRTLWRWLAKPPSPAPSARAAWVPSQDDLDTYTRWHGNASQAWRDRRRTDDGLPTLRTFQRALVRALTPGDRATTRDGVAGRRRHQVYLRWEPEARNQLWEADHTQLEIEILFPRRHRPQRPWLTSFVDGASRALMGWAIAAHPDEATVLAAVGVAIRRDPERGPFAGLPHTIRPDGGLEFATDIMSSACGTFGIYLLPTPPYSPHLKGKVERFYDTVTGAFLAELPHFTDGPRDAAGRLWGNGVPTLTLAQFVTAFDRFGCWYNMEKPHGGLHGQTPLQRWQEDAAPLRLVSDEQLRWTLLGSTPRTVITSGVRFHGLDFIAPELNGLVGETVDVRYRPHDDTSIEVFRGGSHLCTALPQGTLTAEQRAAVLARRRVDAAAQARRQRRATRLLRDRTSPATATEPAVDLTVIGERAGGAVQAGHAEDTLRGAARIDLLLTKHGRGTR